MPKGTPTPPRNKQNPIGGGRIERRTEQRLRKGLRNVQRWLLSRFEDIPKERIEVNAFAYNATRYEYLIDADQLQLIVDELRRRLGEEVPARIMEEAARRAYEQGTGQAVAQLAALTDEYTRDITQVLSGQPWQRRVALVQARQFELMQGFHGDTAADLGRVLSNAVQDGLNPRQVVGTLRERFSVSRSRAERIARTEVTTALRRAQWDEAADARERLGIRSGLLHFSALLPTTRQSHARRHGNVYTQEEVREWYARDANAINCYLPETKVAGRFKAGSKAHYSGEAIEIMTRSGRNVSVTANHPVLTSRGMVPATSVVEGDNLVAHGAEVKGPRGVGDLNDELVNPSIEEVFRTLNELGHSFTARVRAVDFYGDAIGMDKNVDIVNVDRPLPFAINAASSKLLDDLSFVSANPSTAHPEAAFYSDFMAVGLPSPCSVSGCGSSLSEFRVETLGACVGGVGPVPPFKPSIVHPSIEGYSGYSVLSTEGQYRLPGHVLSMDSVYVEPVAGAGVTVGIEPGLSEPVPHCGQAKADILGNILELFPGLAALDDVVSVNVFHYDGPVYDLEESSGLMIADGLILSNCRCSQQPILIDEEGNPVGQDLIDRLGRQRSQFSPGDE